MMRNVLIVMALCWCACNGRASEKTGNKDQDTNAAPPAGYVALRYSTRPAYTSNGVGSDWCKGTLGAPVLVGADATNYSKRIFGLGNGVHHIVVGYGNSTASMMIRRAGSFVEVFTSDQWPGCLSIRQNSEIQAPSALFKYGNETRIHFELQVRDTDKGWLAELTLPDQEGYRMLVRVCEDCQ